METEYLSKMRNSWFSIGGFNSVTLGFIILSIVLFILFIMCISCIGCYEYIFPEFRTYRFNARLRRSRNRAIRHPQSTLKISQAKHDKGELKRKFSTLLRSASRNASIKPSNIVGPQVVETMVWYWFQKLSLYKEILFVSYIIMLIQIVLTIEKQNEEKIYVSIEQMILIS